MEQLAELIKKCHNPQLVIPDEAPNANIIYHVYNDGEISFQKGGDAYLSRSEFIEHYGFVSSVSAAIFPNKITNRDGNNGYAIVTEEDATKIRSEIYKILAERASKKEESKK